MEIIGWVFLVIYYVIGGYMVYGAIVQRARETGRLNVWVTVIFGFTWLTPPLYFMSVYLS